MISERQTIEQMALAEQERIKEQKRQLLAKHAEKEVEQRKQLELNTEMEKLRKINEELMK